MQAQKLILHCHCTLQESGHLWTGNTQDVLPSGRNQMTLLRDLFVIVRMYLDMQYSCAWRVGIIDSSEKLPTGKIPHCNLITPIDKQKKVTLSSFF